MGVGTPRRDVVGRTADDLSGAASIDRRAAPSPPGEGSRKVSSLGTGFRTVTKSISNRLYPKLKSNLEGTVLPRGDRRSFHHNKVGIPLIVVFYSGCQLQ